MQYAFYFDQSKCMSCNTCTVACKDWNLVNPGPVRWRKQQTFEESVGSRFLNLSISCNHCEEPACVPACTYGAIAKRDDGIVAVDRSRCIGLKLCIEACPFAAPQIAEDEQEPAKGAGWSFAHPMQKCGFCWERIDRGDRPVCVSACPVSALDYGDVHDLLNRYPEAERVSYDRFPYAYTPDANGKIDTATRPSLLIRPRRRLKITLLE